MSLNSLFLFLLIQTPTANAQPNNTVQVTCNQVILLIPCIKFVLWYRGELHDNRQNLILCSILSVPTYILLLALCVSSLSRRYCNLTWRWNFYHPWLFQMSSMPASCNSAFQITPEFNNPWHWIKVQKVCIEILFSAATKYHVKLKESMFIKWQKADLHQQVKHINLTLSLFPPLTSLI